MNGRKMNLCIQFDGQLIHQLIQGTYNLRSIYSHVQYQNNLSFTFKKKSFII